MSLHHGSGDAYTLDQDEDEDDSDDDDSPASYISLHHDAML